MARRSIRIAKGVSIRIPSGRSSRGSGYVYSGIERAERASARAAAVEDIAEAERAVTTLHLDPVHVAKPPSVPHQPYIDPLLLSRRWQNEAVQEISIFRRKARKNARLGADQAASAEVQRLRRWNTSEYERMCSERDAEWQKLLLNTPRHVQQAITQALSNIPVKSQYVDISTMPTYCSPLIVLQFDGISLIPEQYATLTPMGRPTVKNRTKTNRNDTYVQALGSAVLAVARRAFAAAPGLDELQVLVLRQGSDTSHKSKTLVPIFHVAFNRVPTLELEWTKINPSEAILNLPTANLVREGRTGEIVEILLGDPRLDRAILKLGPFT